MSCLDLDLVDWGIGIIDDILEVVLDCSPEVAEESIVVVDGFAAFEWSRSCEKDG